MGDMADDDIEQGETLYFLHLAGQCGEHGICPYCEGESKKELGAQDDRH